MHVTTVRGRRYENILIRKFNGRKIFDTKISRITVCTLYSETSEKLTFVLGIPYSLKFSRIKYLVVWLNSAQKQIFADKIFVVECESRKVHTYVYNKY